MRSLAAANGPQRDDLGMVVFDHGSHDTRVWVDVHADATRARLWESRRPKCGRSGFERLWLRRVARSPAIPPGPASRMSGRGGLKRTCRGGVLSQVFFGTSLAYDLPLR